MNVLRDYIAYAKEKIHPRLTGDASHRLTITYSEMRKAGRGKGVITAYPRQLESLIRLAEAHAKVRLSEHVEIVDVDEAWRLHKEAMKQSATDPTTGVIDVSILATGVSSLGRKKKLELVTAVKKLLEMKAPRQTSINTNRLFTELKEGSSWVKDLSFLLLKYIPRKRKVPNN